jgi:hypothetical protein
MKKIFILIATALPLLCQAQTKPYVALSLGYMTQQGTKGYLSAQLTAGAELGKHWCLEYNQNIAMSSQEFAYRYVQVRTGPVFKFNRQYTLHTVAGYSVTSVPTNTSKKIGHGVTAAIYLIQNCGGDYKIKYELSVNNGLHIVPTIGALLTF